eukprot:5126599-Pyramimonas_sp.AAC.1
MRLWEPALCSWEDRPPVANVNLWRIFESCPPVLDVVQRAQRHGPDVLQVALHLGESAALQQVRKRQAGALAGPPEARADLFEELLHDAVEVLLQRLARLVHQRLQMYSTVVQRRTVRAVGGARRSLCEAPL